jgi:glycine cleavage system H protein
MAGLCARPKQKRTNPNRHSAGERILKARKKRRPPLSGKPRSNQPARTGANRPENVATKPPLAPLGTVPAGQQECVWMRAGVINFRLCDRDLDCEHCMLDAALQGRGEQATYAPGDWGPSGYRLFPHDRQFSAAHAWVQATTADSVRVGIDALAAWLTSEIIGVRLPDVGTVVKRGQPIATLLAKGGEITLPSPIDGRVRARNEIVLGCPELATAVPYGAGWLVDVDLTRAEQRKQLPRLLCGEDAETLSRGQLHQFHRRIDALVAARSRRVGPTLADGGQPATDPRTMLGAALYLKLVQELLS